MYIARSFAADANDYVSQNDVLKRGYANVKKALDLLLADYAEYLNVQERSFANQLAWGEKDACSYKDKFKALVLMGSYRVWNDSHKRYPELLKIVRSKNPEWFDSFVRDHETKLKRCKVSVYPIGEALTA